MLEKVCIIHYSNTVRRKGTVLRNDDYSDLGTWSLVCVAVGKFVHRYWKSYAHPAYIYSYSA